MEEKLKAKLKDDETLLWTAKPEAFETLDSTHKKHFVMKGILLSVIFLALIAIYIRAALSTHSTIQIPVILIGLAAYAYGLFGEFMDANKLRNKSLYALTDQRMIAVMGMSVEAVDYERLSDYEFVTDEDGHTSLLCGERAREVKPYGRRSATVCGAQNNAETGECHGFAMYGITAEVKNIERIISGRIGKEA
jgi:hypothetical protein